MRSAYDLVILGGGLSGSWFLFEMLLKLKTIGPEISIAVLDRAGLFFGGLPYGEYSSDRYMLMNPAEELEQTPYPDWCRANGSVGQMFSRRHFGRFLQETLRAAVAGSRHRVDLIVAEAVDLRRADGAGYVLGCGDGAVLRAGTVLLAPGSAPLRALPGLEGVPGYVPDLYRRCWPDLEREMLDRLDPQPHEGNAILVLGTNAAASELVWCVSRSQALRPRLQRVIAVSRHGRFPDGGLSGLPPFVPVALEQPGLDSAAALMAALQADIDRARAAGYSTMDAVLAARPVFFRHFAVLGLDEKRLFATQHAEAWKLATRRTPEAYDGAVRRMLAEGRLQVVAADIDPAAPSWSGGVFRVPVGGGDAVRGRMLVNCLGAAPIAATRDRLLQRIAETYGINGSGHGFPVNSDFAIDTDLYLLGPLLAGFARPDHSIWHLESIPRIVAYARSLAETVAGRMAREAADIFSGGKEYGT